MAGSARFERTSVGSEPTVLTIILGTHIRGYYLARPSWVSRLWQPNHPVIYSLAGPSSWSRSSGLALPGRALFHLSYTRLQLTIFMTRPFVTHTRARITQYYGLATPTGLEPATFRETAGRSSQIELRSDMCGFDYLQVAADLYELFV